jgi:hypothetical protein
MLFSDMFSVLKPVHSMHVFLKCTSYIDTAIYSPMALLCFKNVIQWNVFNAKPNSLTVHQWNSQKNGPIRHVETCPDFFTLQEYTQQNTLSKF